MEHFPVWLLAAKNPVQVLGQRLVYRKIRFASTLAPYWQHNCIFAGEIWSRIPRIEQL
jgi:hypothetical protein